MVGKGLPSYLSMDIILEQHLKVLLWYWFNNLFIKLFYTCSLVVDHLQKFIVSMKLFLLSIIYNYHSKTKTLNIKKWPMTYFWQQSLRKSKIGPYHLKKKDARHFKAKVKVTPIAPIWIGFLGIEMDLKMAAKRFGLASRDGRR